MEEFHCYVYGGHLEVEPTLKLIQSILWWGGMDGDVKKFMGECLKC